jgi:hypothetical protein
MIRSPSTSTTNSNISALKSIQKAETQKKMFLRIRSTLKPIQAGAVSWVNVPIDMLPYLDGPDDAGTKVSADDGNLKSILSRMIRTKRRDGSKEWTKIFDQSKIETAVLLYNHQHFSRQGTLHLVLGPSQNSLAHPAWRQRRIKYYKALYSKTTTPIFSQNFMHSY